MQISSAGPGVFPPQAQAITRPQNGASVETTSSGTKSAESSERSPGSNSGNSRELEEKQRAQVAELKARDREVRAHEAAHMAAAGGLARGAASFSYQVGPDNRRYAVGGEVSIDTSPGNTPQETLQKAQAIRAAALAPAKPSQQDRAVAASAAQMAAQAQHEIAAENSRQGNDASPASQVRAVESYARTAATDPHGSRHIDLVI